MSHASGSFSGRVGAATSNGESLPIMKGLSLRWGKQ